MVNYYFNYLVTLDHKVFERTIIQALKYKPKHQRIYEMFGFAIRLLIKKYYGNFSHLDTVKKNIANQFEKTGLLLSDKYLLESFTAADISFCSHAVFALCLPREQCEALGLGFCHFPEISSLPKGEQEFISQLRESKAGKYVIDVMKAERLHKKPNPYRKYPNRYLPENFPWWCHESVSDVVLKLFSVAFLVVFFWVLFAFAYGNFRMILWTSMASAALYYLNSDKVKKLRTVSVLFNKRA
jgi:hypothetical protein